MKFKLVLPFLLSLLFAQTLFAHDVVGFWKTIDDQTEKPQSVVAIYEYQGKIYGRIIATFGDNGLLKDTIYTPRERAPGVIGKPYYAGMDIIWDLKKDGSRYTNGEIIDPEHGRIYDAEIWVEGGNLIVRGKILFFGRNQTWLPLRNNDLPSGFKKPDLTKLVPQIPKVNDEA